MCTFAPVREGASVRWGEEEGEGEALTGMAPETTPVTATDSAPAPSTPREWSKHAAAAVAEEEEVVGAGARARGRGGFCASDDDRPLALLPLECVDDRRGGTSAAACCCWSKWLE